MTSQSFFNLYPVSEKPAICTDYLSEIGTNEAKEGDLDVLN